MNNTNKFLASGNIRCVLIPGNIEALVPVAELQLLSDCQTRIKDNMVRVLLILVIMLQIKLHLVILVSVQRDLKKQIFCILLVGVFSLQSDL